eukprot:TRINITY_DN120882_c0_g1_i1.p2 TRINITY_DN120882_c0_g1~~TRINITY_DN120882_c0_g1_i1.p2  ORF type:complete len:186 (+),score=66.29 TRINITY_DN120882_c0_g1_i1:139-696(+)
MAMLRVLIISLFIVGSEALANANTKKFWPFDSLFKSSKPAKAAHAKAAATTVAPAVHTAAPAVAAVEQAEETKAAPAVKHEEEPKAAPKPPSVDDTEAVVMASAPFKKRLDGLCKDATAGDDMRKCQHVQGTRLWCAMFARNIQKFLYVDGLKEQRKRCTKINSMEGSDWFMQATWQLNFLQWGR